MLVNVSERLTRYWGWENYYSFIIKDRSLEIESLMVSSWCKSKSKDNGKVIWKRVDKVGKKKEKSKNAKSLHWYDNDGRSMKFYLAEGSSFLTLLQIHNIHVTIPDHTEYMRWIQRMGERIWRIRCRNPKFKMLSKPSLPERCANTSHISSPLLLISSSVRSTTWFYWSVFL